MAYQYSFDRTPWGTLRYWNKTYVVVQDGLKLLRDEIEAWNEKAIQNGAVSAPYQEEIADLSSMIEYGENELSPGHDHMVTFPTVSVGSVRYIKAGLT